MDLANVNSVADLLNANQAEQTVENIIDSIDQRSPAERIEIAAGILHGLLVYADQQAIANLEGTAPDSSPDRAALWAREAGAYHAAWKLAVDQQIDMAG